MSIEAVPHVAARTGAVAAFNRRISSNGALDAAPAIDWFLSVSTAELQCMREPRRINVHEHPPGAVREALVAPHFAKVATGQPIRA